MTLDEALEAGQLADALKAVDALHRRVTANGRKEAGERFEAFALNLDEGFSDHVVLLSPQMTKDALAMIRDLVAQRLLALGVDVEPAGG